MRIVCDSCGRAMDITWLRSLLTKDWKLGWPRYPGSREKRGLEPGPGKLEVRRGGGSLPGEGRPPHQQRPGLPGAPLSSASVQVLPSSTIWKHAPKKGSEQLRDRPAFLLRPGRVSLTLKPGQPVSPQGPDPLEGDPYLREVGFHSLSHCP